MDVDEIARGLDHRLFRAELDHGLDSRLKEFLEVTPVAGMTEP